MNSTSYQQLDVWQRAMNLAEQVYHLSDGFPRSEVFCITSQMRRSGCSVAFNIAEGWGRNNSREFVHFLRISHGSLRECETQLLLSARLKFCAPDDIAPILDNITVISKQIHALSLHLKEKHSKTRDVK